MSERGAKKEKTVVSSRTEECISSWSMLCWKGCRGCVCVCVCVRKKEVRLKLNEERIRHILVPQA